MHTYAQYPIGFVSLENSANIILMDILKTSQLGTSLVVQWLRLRLPKQGVKVRSLVGELGSHMPHGQKTRTYNSSNTVTNSIKTF